MIDLMHELAIGDEVVLAQTVRDVEAAVAGGPLAAILHFEGAEPIDPKLESLEALYEHGLRSLGLVWSRPNAFAEGVAFRFPSTPDIGDGLTEAGRRGQQARDPDRPRAPERARLLGWRGGVGGPPRHQSLERGLAIGRISGPPT